MQEAATPEGPRLSAGTVAEFIRNNTIRNPIQFGGFIALMLIVARIVYNFGFDDNFTYSLEQFVRQTIFGLSQGSIYALIALGYTLVYGILFMINFAHGEVFMAGAYAGFFALVGMRNTGFLEENTIIALLLTLIIGALGSASIAVLLERIAYRPLRNAPRLVPLITAIGASITLQELALRLFGASPRPFPTVNLYVFPQIFGDLEVGEIDGIQYEQSPFSILRPIFYVKENLGIDLLQGIYPVEVFGLELRLRPITFIVFFLSLFVMYGLWYFIQNTKTGRSMRAVAEDKATASLMGINVDRVIVVTFILGGILAGIGGVLFAIIPGGGNVEHRMGFLPGIKAFTAAVVGGIGNVPGAMFGGLFLGFVEAVGPSMLNLDNQLKDVVAFGLLVFILIFRPTGIFGEVVADKKV